MKNTSALALTGATLAVALLSSGCRTIHPTEGAIEPPPAGAEVAPTFETLPVAAPADPAAATPAPAPAIPSAADVGKDGTYVDFVGGSDQPSAADPITVGGLQGHTGRHVSPPPPVPEPAPVVAPAPAGSGFYVVQPGDIFGRIAQKHNVSQRALREANPDVKDPNKIRVGQKLRIPAPGTGLGLRADGPAAPAQGGASRPAAPRRAATLPPKAGYTVYVVQQNDILGRIANRNHTTVKALMEANGITDARKLRAGQPIYVPVSGEAAEPAPAPAEAAAPAPAPAPVEPVSPDGATAGMSDAFLSGVDL